MKRKRKTSNKNAEPMPLNELIGKLTDTTELNRLLAELTDTTDLDRMLAEQNEASQAWLNAYLAELENEL